MWVNIFGYIQNILNFVYILNFNIFFFLYFLFFCSKSLNKFSCFHCQSTHSTKKIICMKIHCHGSWQSCSTLNKSKCGDTSAMAHIDWTLKKKKRQLKKHLMSSCISENYPVVRSISNNLAFFFNANKSTHMAENMPPWRSKFILKKKGQFMKVNSCSGSDRRM